VPVLAAGLPLKIVEYKDEKDLYLAVLQVGGGSTGGERQYGGRGGALFLEPTVL
jgi:hypothetical protein